MSASASSVTPRLTRCLPSTVIRYTTVPSAFVPTAVRGLIPFTLCVIFVFLPPDSSIVPPPKAVFAFSIDGAAETSSLTLSPTFIFSFKNGVIESSIARIYPFSGIVTVPPMLVPFAETVPSVTVTTVIPCGRYGDVPPL